MKIFAKRKKKAVPAGASPPKERSSFASDPIVEELLKKDPKEWNAKQRRMIKRYQDRKTEDAEKNSQSINGQQSSESEVGGSSAQMENSDERKVETNDEYGTEKTSDNEGNDNSESDSKSVHSDDSNTDPGSGDSNKMVPTSRPKSTTEADADVSEPLQKKIWAGSAGVEEEEDAKLDDKIGAEHEVYKLLEKLNSKMKRTLSRKLDREGATAVADVKSEAEKILGGPPSGGSDNGKRKVDMESKDASSSAPKKKKGKKDVDWNNLTPEERLRREEQRRKQQEAAERRARGEGKTPGYKHPLNSERRRANRRKPKWKNGSSSSEPKVVVKNEHNESGYFHRRQKA